MTRRSLAIPVLLAVDVLAALALLLAVWTAVTGGGVYRILGRTVSARTVDNLVTTMLFAALLRIWTAPLLPPFGWTAGKIDGGAHRLLQRAHARARSLSARGARRIVLGTIAVTTLVKLANAWWSFGFLTGDDVEIHEMTFARLFGRHWPIWDLRTPLYPFGFIWPVQAAAKALGVSDTAGLVFAGRCVPLAFSIVNIALVQGVATRLVGSRAVGVIAACLLAMSKLQMTFASTELPRTVAATFLLSALRALLADAKGLRHHVAAGALLAIGASLRFGEAMFLVPAVMHLLLERRFRGASILVVVFGATAALLVGMADRAYWGDAFHSLRSAWAYTVVQGLSSRGYQPFHYYATSLMSWGDPILALLLVGALRSPRHFGVIWIATPVALLSLLPHKEGRYLVAAMPFFCAGAAWTIWAITERLASAGSAGEPSQRPASPRGAAVLAIALGALVLYETGGWRVHRSDDAVLAARFVHAAGCAEKVVAVERLWQVGGRLYLRDAADVVELDEGDIASRAAVADRLASPRVSFALFRGATVERHGYEALLASLGYHRVHRTGTPGIDHGGWLIFAR